MKLKNRTTGQVGDFIINKDHFECVDLEYVPEYRNLSEINAEWEDYEEAKYYYAITSIKADDGITKMKNKHNDMAAFDKSIGNYFETKEEAEKAVEKLRALKRLKDKGFNIYSWDYEFDMVDKPAQTIILRASAVDNSNKDLDLLFGGEE